MERLTRVHELWGWTGLLAFAGLGLTLEALHGVKAGFLLDPEFHLRREMWRLAHAHGTLLSLVQLAFSSALARGRLTQGRAPLASAFLRGALVLLPAGFFLGGVSPSESDPWIGIWLVPVGAGVLLLGLAITVFDLWQSRSARV